MTEQYAIVCVCVGGGEASLVAQKERICQQCRGMEFNPWVGKIPWREWLPTPVFLPEEFHGEKIPASYIPCGGKESDTAEQLVLSVYIYIYAHTNIYYFSIYQFGALDSFHILAVINNAVMNIGVHSSFWISVFVFLDISKCGITKSNDNSTFSFLRKLHIVFHSGCINL